MMVGELFFVFLYLSIQFVYEAVNRCVHVFLCRVGIDLTTVKADCGLRFVA